MKKFKLTAALLVAAIFTINAGPAMAAMRRPGYRPPPPPPRHSHRKRDSSTAENILAVAGGLAILGMAFGNVNSGSSSGATETVYIQNEYGELVPVQVPAGTVPRR